MILPMRHDLFRFSGNYIPSAAIYVSRSDGLAHAGIVYRDKNDDLRRIDFYIEGIVATRPWRGNHPHVVLDFGDDDAVEYLVALCQVMEDELAGKVFPPGYRAGDEAKLADGRVVRLVEAVGGGRITAEEGGKSVTIGDGDLPPRA